MALKGPNKPKISDVGGVEKPGDELSLLSKEIISLIFDKRYDEAESLLGMARKRLPKGQVCRLEALAEVLRAKLAKVENSDASIRQALACLCMLSDMLMDAEHWGEAEIVLSELIGLSLTANEAFFLDDSRFRRAVCLKALGRLDEFKKAKAEIPLGTRIFMGSGLWRVDDI
jgi:hypothetical protein